MFKSHLVFRPTSKESSSEPNLSSSVLSNFGIHRIKSCTNYGLILALSNLRVWDSFAPLCSLLMCPPTGVLHRRWLIDEDMGKEGFLAFSLLSSTKRGLKLTLRGSNSQIPNVTSGWWWHHRPGFHGRESIQMCSSPPDISLDCLEENVWMMYVHADFSSVLWVATAAGKLGLEICTRGLSIHTTSSLCVSVCLFLRQGFPVYFTLALNSQLYTCHPTAGDCRRTFPFACPPCFPSH